MGTIISSSFATENALEKKNDDDGYVKPKFYNGREGPKLTVLDFNKSYATRHVNAALWVSTVVNGTFHDAWMIGVPKLRKYLNGRNVKKCVLPNTCPITMKKVLHANGEEKNSCNDENKIIVSMFISKEYTDDTPPPIDTDLYLQEDYKHTYFAGIFNKFLCLKLINKELDEVTEFMKDRDESFEQWFYSLVIYNTTCKQLEKVKYYEYWFFGKRFEADYKILQA